MARGPLRKTCLRLRTSLVYTVSYSLARLSPRSELYSLMVFYSICQALAVCGSVVFEATNLPNVSSCVPPAKDR